MLGDPERLEATFLHRTGEFDGLHRLVGRKDLHADVHVTDGTASPVEP